MSGFAEAATAMRRLIEVVPLLAKMCLLFVGR